MKKLIFLFLLSVSVAWADSFTATAGDPITFSVTNDGTAPFTYQWSYMPAGGSAVAIPGATGVSYRIPSVKASDTGNYFVTVKNSAGATVSDLATLTVNPVVPVVIPPTKAVTSTKKI